MYGMEIKFLPDNYDLELRKLIKFVYEDGWTDTSMSIGIYDYEVNIYNEGIYTWKRNGDLS